MMKWLRWPVKLSPRSLTCVFLDHLHESESCFRLSAQIRFIEKDNRSVPHCSNCEAVLPW